MIELVPTLYKQLVTNRPNELFTKNAAVCSKPKTLHYYSAANGGATSGIWEFTMPSFRAKWWKGVDKARDTTPINCLPLQTILDEHFGMGAHVYLDFFSLDVEGAELEVLRSVDFARTAFGVLLVECDGQNARKDLAVRMLLQSKGYTWTRSFGRSWWFVNNQFAQVYSEFM